MSIPGLQGIIAGGRVRGLAGFPALAEYDAANTPRHAVTANGGVVSGNIAEWFSDEFTSPVINTNKFVVDERVNRTTNAVNENLRLSLTGSGSYAANNFDNNVVLKGPFDVTMFVTDITPPPSGRFYVEVSFQYGAARALMQYERLGTGQLRYNCDFVTDTVAYTENLSSPITEFTVRFLRDKSGVTRIYLNDVLKYTSAVNNDTVTLPRFAVGIEPAAKVISADFNYMRIDAGNLSTTRLLPENYGSTSTLDDWYVNPTRDVGTITVVGDKHRFVVSNTATNIHEHILNHYPLVGNFRLDVDFDLIEWGSQDQQWAGIGVNDDNGNTPHFARTYKAGEGDIVRYWTGSTYASVAVNPMSGTFTILKLGTAIYYFVDNTYIGSAISNAQVTEIRVFTRSDNNQVTADFNNVTIDAGNLSTSKLIPSWHSDNFEQALNVIKWAQSLIGSSTGAVAEVTGGKYWSGYTSTGVTGHKDNVLTSRLVGLDKSFVYRATINTNDMDVDGGAGAWSQSIWFGFNVLTSFTGIRFYSDNSGTLSISIRNNGTEVWSAATFDGYTDYDLEIERVHDTISFKIDGDIKASVTNSSTLNSPYWQVRQSEDGCPAFTVSIDDVVFTGSPRARMFLQSADDKVIKFDGTGYLTVTQNTDFIITDYYTISCLASFDDLTNLLTIFALWQDANNRFRFDYSPTTNRIECSYMSGGSWVFDHYVDYPEGIELNRLYLFTLVRNGSSWQLMIDGLKVGSPLVYAGDITLSSDLYIGDYSASGIPHKGNIVWMSVNNKTLYSGEFTPSALIPNTLPSSILLVDQSTRDLALLAYSISYSESFSGILGDTEWIGRGWTPGSWTGTGTESIEDGKLVISVGTGSNSRYMQPNEPDTDTAFTRQIDWEVDSWGSPTSTDTTNAALFVRIASEEVSIWIRKGESDFFLEGYEDGVTPLFHLTIPEVLSGKFRIRRTIDNTLYLEYDVGSGWQVGWSGIKSGTCEAYRGPTVRVTGSGPAQTVRFDNYVSLNENGSDVLVTVNQNGASLWEDSIGTPEDLTSSGADRPILEPNVSNNPALLFSAINKFALGQRLLSNNRFFAVSIINLTSLPTTSGWVWSQSSSQGDFGLQVLSDGKLSIHDGLSGHTLPPASQLSTGQTYYIFVEYDDGIVNTWLDGILIDVSNITFLFDGSNFTIGQSDAGGDGIVGYHFYHKFVDDYNGTITQSDITALYKKLLRKYLKEVYLYELLSYTYLPQPDVWQYDLVASITQPQPDVWQYDLVSW